MDHAHTAVGAVFTIESMAPGCVIQNDDFMVSFAFERDVCRHKSGPLVTVEFIDCPGNSGGRSGLGRRFRGSVIFDEGLNAFSSSELSANFLTPTLCGHGTVYQLCCQQVHAALDVIILSWIWRVCHLQCSG